MNDETFEQIVGVTTVVRLGQFCQPIMLVINSDFIIINFDFITLKLFYLITGMLVLLFYNNKIKINNQNIDFIIC